MNLTHTPEFYYMLRTILLALAGGMLIAASVYGKKVHILRILGKRTGITKRRELTKIKAGKALGRRRVSGRELAGVISVEQGKNAAGTQRLDEMEEEGDDSMEATAVLSQQDEEFRVITSILVANADPSTDLL